MVAKKYNEQMASRLLEFGIEFIEIPRKMTYEYLIGEYAK